MFFYRLPKGPILAKDLAIEYKYLSNTSEWFFIARKRAESVIQGGRPQKIGKPSFLLFCHFVVCCVTTGEVNNGRLRG